MTDDMCRFYHNGEALKPMEPHDRIVLVWKLVRYFISLYNNE